MRGELEVVFLDVGGVLYPDEPYKFALFRALRDLGGDLSAQAFEDEYRACRRDQSGSFRYRLTKRFLGPEGDTRAVERAASRYWAYPEGSLIDDVLPALEELRATGYRLGVIANQQSTIRDAMRRDGIARFFDVWAVSDDVGLEKPDPRLFGHALGAAGVTGARAAMVGDRLDYDVRPAKAVGMRAVWVLRGEAPDDPTPEQLAEPDASVRTLPELREALEGA